MIGGMITGEAEIEIESVIGVVTGGIGIEIETGGMETDTVVIEIATAPATDIETVTGTATAIATRTVLETPSANLDPHQPLNLLPLPQQVNP